MLNAVCYFLTLISTSAQRFLLLSHSYLTKWSTLCLLSHQYLTVLNAPCYIQLSPRLLSHKVVNALFTVSPVSHSAQRSLLHTAWSQTLISQSGHRSVYCPTSISQCSALPVTYSLVPDSYLTKWSTLCLLSHQYLTVLSAPCYIQLSPRLGSDRPKSADESPCQWRISDWRSHLTSH